MSNVIPKEKTKPTNHFDDKIVLIYGDPKIGKSTLASQFPDTLFLATEDGLRSLEVFKIPEIGCFTSFDKLMEAVEAVQQHVMLKKKPLFKTLCIDTIDKVYRLAEEKTCKEKGIATLGDAGFAKGYHACDALLHQFGAAISKCGLGLVLISHSVENTNDSTGLTRTEPSLAPRARKIFEPMADIILACVLKRDGSRIIKTKSSLTLIAGDRTGRLPAELPLFYNELITSFEEGRTTKAVLLDRCNSGLKTLEQLKWNKFDNKEKVVEYLKRNLGCPLEDASEPQLETLVRLLTKEYKEYEKDEKEETNERSGQQPSAGIPKAS